MCIICVSPKGVRQPSFETIKTMFNRNPHGAGYMCIRDGRVFISKGYMFVHQFLYAVEHENFTAEDSVVYHFRISTQGGVKPEMTHPFPLSRNLEDMKALDVFCRCGVAHNGIIPVTADDKNKTYSDTALFVTKYLADLIRKPSDLHNPKTLHLIETLAQSKLAIMDENGDIETVGDFINIDGLLFSNRSFMPYAIRAC